jgi:acetoin utilization deacetylase AcuC-like enzyme
MIFISAGFDAHTEDPLAQLGLVEEDYVWVTEFIMKIAARHARARIVSSLEGGYHLPALSRSAVAHIKTLAGIQPGLQPG